jgi:hypothetical protein
MKHFTETKGSTVHCHRILGLCRTSGGNGGGDILIESVFQFLKAIISSIGNSHMWPVK